MATYSEEDKHNALVYAMEKLRQESIFRLKMTEPNVYSFIKVKEIENGWRDVMGLMTEPNQKLAPYRSITYDTSILTCEHFSCIPVDVRKRPSYDGEEEEDDEVVKVSACSFTEHTSIELELKNPRGDTLHQLTACGAGCYRRQKKRNPHTGMPEAGGALLREHVDPKTGEKTCQYLNQNLILWAAIPWSRPGKEKEGYNTVHVPGFGFREEDEEGGHHLFNRVAISKDYCNFFKQYYDDETGECYRSGWMKTVKFMFGQYFTNLTYVMANPETIPGYPNTWEYFMARLGGPDIRSFMAAGTTSSFQGQTVREKPLDTGKWPPSRSSPTPPVYEEAAAAAEKGEEGDKKKKKKKKKSEKAFETQKESNENVGTQKESGDILWEMLSRDRSSADKLMEVSDSMLSTAMNLEAMGVDERRARKLLLREMLKRSRQMPERGGFANTISFSDSLKIAGTILALKKSLFARQRESEKRHHEQDAAKSANHDNDAILCNRWRSDKVTERDALLLVRANLESASERPRSFLDPIPARGDYLETAGSSLDIWKDIQRKTNVIVGNSEKFIKHFVVNVVRGLLNIVEGKLFMDNSNWENNIPLMFGADFLLNKILTAAGKLCTKFASFAESRAVAFTSDTVSSLAAKVSVDISIKAFGVFIEETLVEIVVSAALRTAIQAFAALAELASSVLTVLGVALTVAMILGLILDIALKLDWYDQIITPEALANAVLAFEESFARAAHEDLGHNRIVSAEEIVAIDVSIQIRNEAEILEEKGETELEAYLEMAFHEGSLLGKSSMSFIQEASEEYLAGRTMNSVGQRIVWDQQQPDDDIIDREARREIAEMGTLLQDYAKVVNYNSSRLDYVGAEWMKNAAGTAEDGGATKVLFRKTVAFTAAAGFALVLGVGAGLVVTHVTTVRMANIGLSLAFVGLLTFITLAGIAFINLNAMGEVNAHAIGSLEPILVNRKLFQRDRVGHVQTMTGVGARLNMLSDFTQPLLNKMINE
uniref:Wsv115-like protein n=1 Tax=Metapenaeus ensis nimavirus TaxID=2133794 RepID=A0A401IPH5_9VIRU|nr:MAG: wsv115-like protein [Metapenaeus ensis nimavirus]GBG35501.1 wsv115-like protein [Metapenaeus ensis nimavirus]